MTSTVTRKELLNVLNDLLQPQLYKDYCPNGLQVEGKNEIGKIVSGVTACQALIDAAIDHKADCILVHHGVFWHGDQGALVGMKKNRVKALLEHDINLIAYHLPLDGHDRLGNNAQLADKLQLEGIFDHAGTRDLTARACDMPGIGGADTVAGIANGVRK